jgi:uncharacterized protein YpmB
MTLNKKSQITLIIIFVVALILVSVVIFYFTSSTVEKESQQEVQTAQETTLETQPVRTYVESCLDKVASEAVNLIGFQGGRIYQSQGGISPDYRTTAKGVKYVDEQGYRIPYAIYKPIGNIGIPPFYFSKLPEYPWPTFPYYSNPPAPEFFYGYFGLTDLPPLRKPHPESLQEQLESYVTSNLQKCTDWNAFKSMGLTIESSDVITNVTFAINHLLFDVNFPLKITNKNTGATTTIDHFQTKIAVRLTNIYDFVKQIISYEVSDISYSIRNAYLGSIRVSVRGDIYDNDDLIIVKDTQSEVSGNPFEFWFMRHNRPPALYYISDHFGHFHLNDVMNNETISTKAIDPDEDELTFIYNPTVIGLADLPPVVNTTKEITVKVSVTDNEFEDYQYVTVSTERLS